MEKNKKEGGRTEGKKMRRKEGKILKINDQLLNSNKENTRSKVQELSVTMLLLINSGN